MISRAMVVTDGPLPGTDGKVNTLRSKHILCFPIKLFLSIFYDYQALPCTRMTSACVGLLSFKVMVANHCFLLVTCVVLVKLAGTWSVKLLSLRRWQ